MPRYDEFGDTVPTDHAPLEGEPRKPLYPPREAPDDSGPSKRFLAAVLLVAICALAVILAVPVRG